MRFDRDDFGSNVEDRGRGSGGGLGFGGGGGGIGGMLIPLVASRFGIGGIVVLLIGMAIFGGFSGMFGGGAGVVGAGGGGTGKSVEEVCRSNDVYKSTCNAFGSTERVWTQLFQANGQRYQPPKLVFYQGGTTSGCGSAQSAMGPFYCPADQGIYIDTSFFDELASRFQAPGDFAAFYVVAHEAGHHIQTVTGITNRIRRAQGGVSETQSNALQVRMELQADCLAGVWASNVNISGDSLDPGDLEEGLRAAQAIGDDRLQQSAGRAVRPESFTHGSSAQRQEALRRGFQGRTLESCASYTQGV